ncbi:hypothetical protein [Massilia sp. TWR1-2-2]|uniref:hypothetical protein n=1 Tax=Massilia sp. TWR1-2-2 TaxID=2804584 RepID=UPI003CF00563
MENSASNMADLATLLGRVAHRRRSRQIVEGRTSPESEHKLPRHGNHQMNSSTFRAPVNFTVTNANAFALLVNFSRAARAAGWTDTQVDETVDHAMLRDYHHLQCTLAAYTVEYLTDD